MFRVQGSGFRVQGSEFRVQGSGFRVQGSGFRVQCSVFRVLSSEKGTSRRRAFRSARSLPFFSKALCFQGRGSAGCCDRGGKTKKCFPVLSSRSGPVDPSFRALFERLKFTVRRHTCNKDSLSFQKYRRTSPPVPRHNKLLQQMVCQRLPWLLAHHILGGY